MPKLLVVDDEPNGSASDRERFASIELEVIVAPTGRQGVELVQQTRPDAVILDVRLSDMSGLDVFDQIRHAAPRLPVIIITAYASTETAIEAMKRGAFEYLLKPVDLHQLREVVQRALELSRFRQVPAVFEDEDAGEDAERIIGQSAAMQEVYKAIGRFAPRDETVLITGESGTGKELVARALFHHSSRAAFFWPHRAAIPETLLESDFRCCVRHRRAERDSIGKFEQAHQGTLFLDEIGDMSPATQAKILRILQEHCFERLGSNETIQNDVRLLAATNKNLEAEVAAGRFRQDLFYRLNVFAIRLPPLRERRDDVPLLIEHFLRHFSRTLSRSVHSVSAEARACLQAYDWPGNVRQLQNVLKYALIQAAGGVVTLECLPEDLRPNASSQAAASPEGRQLEIHAFTMSSFMPGNRIAYCVTAEGTGRST